MSDRLLHRQDAYLAEVDDVRIEEVRHDGGVILDRTIFYAASGGQPGDVGELRLPDGRAVAVIDAVTSESEEFPLHVVSPSDAKTLSAGTSVHARIDWETRHLHMRMHSCMHLMCSLLPEYPVTGGSIGRRDAGARLDFDIPDAGAIDKTRLTERLAELVAADHPIQSRRIDADELLRRPELVRTSGAFPPTESGTVRLVGIGREEDIDLQPCGGTHVRSTAEIGHVYVSKIEKKGRGNRRIRLAFGSPPS